MRLSTRFVTAATSLTLISSYGVAEGAPPAFDTKTLSVQKGDPVDIEALARIYDRTRARVSEFGTDDNKIPAGLFIFVSFGMPKGVLTRLVQEAERTHATVLVRGMKNHSMAETAQAAADAIGKCQVAWLVDPLAFRRYKVEQVPAFVIVQPGASAQSCSSTQCNGAVNYAKLEGDVSIRFALEEIQRQSDPALASIAASYLVNLDKEQP